MSAAVGNKPGARLRVAPPKPKPVYGKQAHVWFPHKLRPLPARSGTQQFQLDHTDGAHTKRFYSYFDVLQFFKQPEAERIWDKRKKHKGG